MCPLVAALGSPVVCRPAPVTQLFALVFSGLETCKNLGLDFFLKDNFIEI